MKYNILYMWLDKDSHFLITWVNAAVEMFYVSAHSRQTWWEQLLRLQSAEKLPNLHRVHANCYMFFSVNIHKQKCRSVPGSSDLLSSSSCFCQYSQWRWWSDLLLWLTVRFGCFDFETNYCSYSWYFILHLLMVTASVLTICWLWSFLHFSSISNLRHHLHHLFSNRKPSHLKLGVDQLTIHWHLKAACPPFGSCHLHTRNLPEDSGQFLVAVPVTSSFTIFNVD